MSFRNIASQFKTAHTKHALRVELDPSQTYSEYGMEIQTYLVHDDSGTKIGEVYEYAGNGWDTEYKAVDTNGGTGAGWGHGNECTDLYEAAESLTRISSRKTASAYVECGECGWEGYVGPYQDCPECGGPEMYRVEAARKTAARRKTAFQSGDRVVDDSGKEWEIVEPMRTVDYNNPDAVAWIVRKPGSESVPEDMVLYRDEMRLAKRKTAVVYIPTIGCWYHDDCIPEESAYEAQPRTLDDVIDAVNWDGGFPTCDHCNGAFFEDLGNDSEYHSVDDLRLISHKTASRRKTAEVQWIEVTAPSTYRAYLPVRGGKYHLASGLPQWPVSACNEEDLDTSTMQLINANSPARASSFCPKCAKIIAQMEAER